MCNEKNLEAKFLFSIAFMLDNMSRQQGPVCVITVCAVCVSVCVSVCVRCCMSFSVSAIEADVLVGQNYRVLLPCVRITRWPLFPGTAGHSHPPKVHFQSAVCCSPAWLSGDQEKKEHLSVSEQERLQGSPKNMQLFPDFSFFSFFFSRVWPAGCNRDWKYSLK